MVFVNKKEAIGSQNLIIVLQKPHLIATVGKDKQT